MLSKQVLKIIANSDPGLFEHHLKQAGLTIIGKLDNNPLRNTIQAESIIAISTSIDVDINDQPMMSEYQLQLSNIAEQHGYLIGLIEGLDQMPGTWVDPVKMALHKDKEPDSAKDQDTEEEPDASEAVPPPT